jgi:putative transposase
MRKYPLRNNKVYHTFTKSIAGYEIFRDNTDFQRIINLFQYFRAQKPPLRFSVFLDAKKKNNFNEDHFNSKNNLVEIVAYCIMPTHIHLILKQLKKNGISVFMRNVLNSYTRFFNIKNKRKGPLWEGRFKNVEVETDEQLLHLTRYVHLNPVTAGIVHKPDEWMFSSYREFLGLIENKNRMCKYLNVLDVKYDEYRRFVSSGKDYQKELAEIKALCLE